MTALAIPLAQARQVYPGAALCTVLALAGSFLAEHYGAPALLLTLLLGLGFSAHAQDERLNAGIDFCTRTVLRVGVALLGVRIGLDQLESAGMIPLLLAVIGVPLILLAAIASGRLLRLPRFHSLVAGAAVAICGVSAAIAVAAVLPRGKLQERSLLGIAVGATALGTAAMVFYPPLAAQLAFGELEAGMFLGATIHDVAQAAGAGYLISPAGGDIATLTKLVRVAMLAPVVIVIAVVAGRRESATALPPRFLIAFVALAAINSTGNIPDAVRGTLIAVSSWCLLITMAALGVRTSIASLLSLGWRPLAQMTLLSALLAAFAAGVLTVIANTTEFDPPVTPFISTIDQRSAQP